MLSRLAYACASSALVVFAGCAKTTDLPAGGSESHFLMACTDSSECGAELECRDEVCTRECETDAVCEALSPDATCLAPVGGGQRLCGVERDGDAAVPDGGDPEDYIRESEPLGEPVQMAFIAGLDSDEQVWLRGEEGTARQITTWPAAPGRAASCGNLSYSGVYPSGSGRFANLAFDPSGRFLVFTESLACGDGQRALVLAHELATGETHSLGSFQDLPLVVLADAHAAIVIAHRDDAIDLYELHLDDLTVDKIDVPEGNLVDSGWPQLVGLETSSLLMVPGLPALERTEAGSFELSELDVLVPSHTFGPLGRDALGTRVCTVASDRESEARTAVLLSLDDAWLQEINGSQATAGTRCAISADGGHLMFGSATFEMTEGLLNPMNVPPSDAGVWGAYGETFYATTPEGEVVQLNLETGTRQTVVDVDELDFLCQGAATETALTTMSMPYDERPVAIVKRYCGCTDCDTSGSLALRLDRGTHEVVELRAGEHDAYGIAWPVAGGAYVLSSQRQPGQGDPSTPDYVEVSAYGETSSMPGLDGVPLLHGPVAPRRRPVANAAPASCGLGELSHLLLAGQAFEDCGHVMLDDDREPALQCAAAAYEASSAFRVIWRTQGEDSILESALVGRADPSGYQVFDLQFDSFGWVDLGTASFTDCVGHGTARCESGSGECPTCESAGTRCYCNPHDMSGNGVAVHCVEP